MIYLCNGSGKPVNSNSGYFLDVVKQDLSEQTTQIRLNDKLDVKGFADMLKSGDCLVFAMCLYVDGVPASVVAIMEKLEEYFKERPVSDVSVYVIANCGFVEGHQNHILMRIMKNWCARTGLCWKQGVGIGGGEALVIAMADVPLGKGPKTSLGRELKALAAHINKREASEVRYVSPDMCPKWAFLLVGNAFWNQMAAKNGVSRKQIRRRLVKEGIR